MKITLNEEENQHLENGVKLPERIREILDKLPEIGYILFSGISTEDIIPPTPTENNQNIGGNTTLGRIQSIFMSSISHLVSYEGECNGSLFQDIVPVKQTEQMQISTSSLNELEVHTEQAFSTYKPDYISLACLRGANDAITYLLDVEEIRKHLTEKEYNMLWLPLWMIGVDASFLSDRKSVV